MTHPEDITAFLKAKLEDRNPKCANCKFYGYPQRAVSPCTKPDNAYAVTWSHILVQPSVANLSLCSAWEKKE